MEPVAAKRPPTARAGNRVDSFPQVAGFGLHIYISVARPNAIASSVKNPSDETLGPRNFYLLTSSDNQS